MMSRATQHRQSEASPYSVRVKICGLTSVEDALAASAAGADWVGLNFYPKSPRFISDDIARAIVAALPAQTQAVGLFVDRAPEEVLAISERIGFRIVQLAGSEPAEHLSALGDLHLIRTFRLGDLASLESMQSYLAQAVSAGRVPDAVLLDAFVPGQLGGTGHTVAPDVLDALPAGLPPVILAGGLTPENVAARIGRVRPWMVDVASGVESSPGRKSAERMAAFICAARSVRTENCP